MRTKPKPDPWDGGDAPDRLVDETQDGLTRAIEKIERLQKFLAEHGVSSLVLLSTHDPMTEYCHQEVRTKGNYYQTVGAVRLWLNKAEGS